ncbi:hypothetical protein CMUS01_14395 [Colletotrichum musicola]|uniref:Uncharacterized protein n=1 Tax=Colletotrichum musicola TaxID=2175873 RepID=A0A8H6MS70_9PEZI|nr:hypothetical protein CMUS01_14395 [Colletotrichum musicola]
MEPSKSGARPSGENRDSSQQPSPPNVDAPEPKGERIQPDSPDPQPPIDDYYIEEDFDEQYGVGKFLHITKHRPKPPYGSPLYPYLEWVDVKSLGMQMEDADISRTSAVFDWKPSNYNPDYESSKPNNFTLEIAELISGDTEDGNLVLRCKVIKESSAWTRLKEALMGRPAPQSDQEEDEQPVDLSDTVVAKTARADMDYCLEAAAYEKLKLVNCHGEPWLAPAYYGTYTTRIQTANPGLKGKVRHVGLILMEHIDGQSMGSYCPIDDEDVLHPNVFATIRVGSEDLKLDEKLRLTLLQRCRQRNANNSTSNQPNQMRPFLLPN